MDDKTEGIVLQSLRYGDTSLIVKVFTRQHGMKSYMLKGAFNHSSKNRAALFQNLNVVSYVEVNAPKSHNLNYLKDAQIAMAYHSLPFVMNKSAIMMYVSELLSKTITEQEQNEALYNFVFQSVVWLDLVESGYANFPLYFTLELSRFLGFYPQSDYKADTYFDMMEGHFVASLPVHPYYMDKEQSMVLAQLMNLGIDEMASVPMSGLQRNDLLDRILTFMRLHAPVLKGLQSHEVLKAVLR